MENRPWPGGGDGPEPQEPLRDWQRQDTWYGPFPGEENPFDEPEDAPELRELRSEELNNRSGDFWQSQTTGYRFGNTTAPDNKNAERKPKQPASPKLKRIRVLSVLAGFLAVGLILYYGVFTVRFVQVIGNDKIPSGEIIRLSGIRIGTPLYGLNTESIERGIRKNPELIFRYLEKDPPGTVILRVQEREACCWMTWNGIFYTMDKQRTVLFESEILPRQLMRSTRAEAKSGEEGQEETGESGEENEAESGENGNPDGTRQAETSEKDREERDKVTALTEELVRVDGLKIRSGTLKGQTLVLEDTLQQTVFSQLFLEMKVLGCTNQIADADLGNPDSILLTTRDGFTVALGNSQNIHAKLRSMLLTREKLLEMNKRGGVINVILPETPIYSPPGT